MRLDAKPSSIDSDESGWREGGNFPYQNGEKMWKIAFSTIFLGGGGVTERNHIKLLLFKYADIKN